MLRKKDKIMWHAPAQGAQYYGEYGRLPTVKVGSTGLSISAEAYRQAGEPEYVLVGLIAPYQLVIKGCGKREEGSWKCIKTGQWQGRMVGGTRMLPWIQSHFPFVEDGQVFLLEWDDDYDAWALDLKVPINEEEGDDDGYV